MLRTLVLAAAAQSLIGCASYGYAYDYDPYRGPTGHYVAAGDPGRSGLPCANVYYTGPHDGGWRGDYYAGPFCAPSVGQAAADAAGP